MPNVVINDTFITKSVTHNGEYYGIYITRIAFTEGEICRIMWRSLFCALFSYAGTQTIGYIMLSMERTCSINVMALLGLVSLTASKYRI